MKTVTERFLAYVGYETTSCEANECCPSTPNQMALARALVAEMQELGIADARVDEHGYVYGTIPAKGDHSARVGFIAHMDTSDAVKGPTHPRMVKNYDGGAIPLENGVVMTERLAGSYARGKTPKEDEMQAEALRVDPKAIDEHNMLVDDSRNEFGFVCRPGTVAVSHYLNIVRCARVMHLGSTITGTLKPEMGALDVINAIMPSGAVSGAPKVRACEIINEIEGERRGIYGSAVGYIGFDGDADFFAFIHSAFLKDGRLTVRAGGGIVIDSDPQEEYREAKVKAEAMLQTIKLAAKEEEHGSHY